MFSQTSRGEINVDDIHGGDTLPSQSINLRDPSQLDKEIEWKQVPQST